MIKKKLKIIIIIASLLIGMEPMFLLTQSMAQDDIFASSSVQASSQEIQANTAIMATPAAAPLAESAFPPVPTAEQLAASEIMDAIIQDAWEDAYFYLDPNQNHPVAGPAGGETSRTKVLFNAPGTFLTFRSIALSPTTGSSAINEPSHATSGKDVFYTGNWYAARSSDGGVTWTYINPYGDFSDFCCDQDVIVDRGRNIFLWYRQGVANSSGQNVFKLGVSSNGGVSFCTYTTGPTNVNSTWTNQWFDYPHLALSNDFLYITTNMFNSSSAYVRTAVLRWPLDSLATCAGFSYNYWTTTNGTITPVQGATETMYLGTTISSAGTFRVYTQSESTTTLSSIDRAVPAWTFTSRNGNCPTPNNFDPCDRPDQRVLSGWVSKGVIGFFWNVKEGGGFTFPYVEAATFRESDKVVLGRPYIFNNSFAWQYGAAAPNARGDVGIGAYLIGGGNYPKFYVGVDDDFNGAPPGWELYSVASSNNWNRSAIGDYIRIRSFLPLGTFWTASGHRGITNTSGGVTYQPRYNAFGRERDLPGFNRWNNK